jgi:hypothetical protein
MDTTGTTDTGATGDTGSGTTSCMPITEDDSAIGAMCLDNQDCPAGYTCFDSGGIVPSFNCEILCEEDCDCPGQLECVEMNIKGQMWMQCSPP